MNELSYVRNEAARQLRLGHSRTLGVITPNASNPFFADVAAAAEDAAAEAGYTVIVGNSNGSDERETGYLDLFEKLRVSGVLVAPVDQPGPRLRRMRERGIAAVILGGVGSDDSFSSVSVDDVAGAGLAVDHLVQTGRRRLAFVGGPLMTRQVLDRMAGASQAARKHTNVALEFIEVSAMTVEEGRNIGHHLSQRPAADRPDGIFAGNDLLAIGLAAILFDDARVALPDRIGLVGYDDIAFASSSTLPLTSVRQPSDLIGHSSIEVLLQDAQDPDGAPRHILYQPELVIRASSMPHAPALASEPASAR